VLGCDMVVVNDYWALSKIRADRSQVVLNNYQAMPGGFTMKPDMLFPAADIVQSVRTALGGREPLSIEATELATALLGDSIAANLFMLGYAWQQGLVPLAFESIDRAIELNGAAVAMNRQAFGWGRLAAVDPQKVREAAGLVSEPAAAAATVLDDSALSQSLDDRIARRIAFLTDYQNAAYAERYRALVDTVRAREQQVLPGSTVLSEAVARYYFKLLAYKDEYEVARLHTSDEFRRQIEQTFDGTYTIHFHLAPPLFAKKNAEGHLVKAEYGGWVYRAFALLAKLRGLRGSAIDPFGYTAERKMERQLIVDYARTIEELLAGLNVDRLSLAVQIAEIPEQIRGFGHVKHAHLQPALARQAELLAAWRNPKTITAELVAA
jgi:indolepyruvate ferredoxin oxidoreductase